MNFQSDNQSSIFPEIIKKDTVKPEEMDYWELALFISKLKDTFSDMTENPSPKEVFLKLRELRNSW